ncbi:preprotein translocase subunit YajC [Corynebacterium diphtheriae bv. mitis]|uniref:preprotein translocase subunit YajC n=1 Tax=Corynebacterium diphtheriae TaxID=1717 RepID=UPI0018CB1A29|nr:preprotein translocase subunit YajC [Corynebacterium diphtheriae bv. gravis]MBG9250500.1 preprotein translocase subunit YajC [Corynebacterium diphtheriae bv. mitis]MBG9255664.1 preprotein translocase subunit YajC [Corynebacterium diphtheriae bv. mitis]MBG9261411.1 preprotein translocase subunit YajC [Corynebacterium diphtheriae bv. mitis]MBG9268164.1 preprotein translocase subunit YajC [Corynebacterium diphtheriae bv. mitis]
MSMTSTLLLYVALVVVFVLPSLLIRRRQKQHLDRLKKNLQESMMIGQRVITTAGVHAVIKGIAENTVDLEIAPNILVTFEKSAVISIEDNKSNSELEA